MNDNIGVGIIVGLAIGSSTYIWNSDNFTKYQKYTLLFFILFPPLQWISAILLFVYNKVRAENFQQRVNGKPLEKKGKKRKKKHRVNVDISRQTLIFLFSILMIILVAIIGFNLNIENNEKSKFAPDVNTTEGVSGNVVDVPNYITLSNSDLAHNLNENYFIGKWMCDNTTIYIYNAGGRYTYRDKNGGEESSMEWAFNEGKFYMGYLHRFYIVDYSKNHFTAKTEENNSEFVFRRMN